LRFLKPTHYRPGVAISVSLVLAMLPPLGVGVAVCAVAQVVRDSSLDYLYG